MPLNIAVLGAGRIGQVHAAAVASVPDANLVAVSDPDSAAAESLRDRFGAEIKSIADIHDSADIDAVIICTPTDTHADLIDLFARAGKAVFCEKPIDLDVARVRASLEVVNETSATLMVGFNRRFDPDFNELKAAIDGGLVGDVEMVTITSRDPGPPSYGYIERSGGIFRDMTIHDFDVARWLLDEEIESVFAAGSVLVDTGIGARGDFDSVNVIMKTPSGRQAVITNSRRAVYGYDQRIEVHGSAGAISAQNQHEARIELADAHGYHRPPLMNFFMNRYEAAYAAEIAAFVHAAVSKTQPPTTGDDGLMALVLAEAAVRSTTEARAVNVAEILG
ncbi:MAG: inositol 2-dehydrogenase [Boseongicola sp.]